MTPTQPKSKTFQYTDWWKLLFGLKMFDLNINYYAEFTEKGVIMHDERKLKNIHYEDFFNYKNPLERLSQALNKP